MEWQIPITIQLNLLCDTRDRCRVLDIQILQSIWWVWTSNLYLHTNISSLSYHFDDLKYLVENFQNKPKVLGITECRLRTNRTVLSNIDLKDHTPTPASKCWILIYIHNKLKYKTPNVLKLYKERKIKCTFPDIIEPHKKDKIVGCIYKHPNVLVTEFTNDYMGSPL